MDRYEQEYNLVPLRTALKNACGAYIKFHEKNGASTERISLCHWVHHGKKGLSRAKKLLMRLTEAETIDQIATIIKGLNTPQHELYGSGNHKASLKTCLKQALLAFYIPMTEDEFKAQIKKILDHLNITEKEITTAASHIYHSLYLS